ncbi:hypothetical protein PRABACTJOHN_01553 [Parabacteroides johnsonii DSM 18315]|uniref:Uncharacterized protein n=1 Tax=Parabacteroides johnsonii DSM 18315 TaxID=537006 RepID=B7B951_9BACT|nr:hypothetical protein PRABACTJOHN_01553 [Parabacteroides johnsonii DSM 18315]
MASTALHKFFFFILIKNKIIILFIERYFLVSRFLAHSLQIDHQS